MILSHTLCMHCPRCNRDKKKLPCRKVKTDGDSLEHNTRVRLLLIEIPFTVVTDCHAILNLNTKRTESTNSTLANMLSKYE